MHNISYFILSYSLVIQSPNHIAAVPSKDISKQQNSPIHIQVRKVRSYVVIDDCIVLYSCTYKENTCTIFYMMIIVCSLFVFMIVNCRVSMVL